MAFIHDHSCIGIRYAKLFESAKSMFKSCLNMAFTWQSLSGLWYVCMTLQRKRSALTNHFAIAFVCENVALVYDVFATLWRSKVLRWRHFEILCKKRGSLMFKGRFQWG